MHERAEDKIKELNDRKHDYKQAIYYAEQTLKMHRSDFDSSIEFHNEMNNAYDKKCEALKYYNFAENRIKELNDNIKKYEQMLSELQSTNN